MENIARKHQKAIARKTLKMSIAGARILGGMTHAEAYQILFGISLKDRIDMLRREYPEPCDLCFELNAYGWTWEDLPTLAQAAEA